MMRSTLTGLALLSLGSFLVACGDPPSLYGDSNAANSSMTKKTAMPDMAQLAPYPPPPYGNQAGDVLANLKVTGYRMSPTQTDSTQLMWDDTITLEDFHANPKLKCMLISFSATWCNPCNQEQGVLPGDVANDPSFGVLNILIEGPVDGSQMVTKDDVDNWTQKFSQNYPVVTGGDSSGKSRQDLESLWIGWGPGGSNSIGLPFNMVVRTTDMQVADVIQGFGPTIHDDAVAKCEALP